MNFKKSLRKQIGQSFIEYLLLAALAVIALVSTDFLLKTKENVFENHFQTVAGFMGVTID
ncbi:MAG: hypothetical protein HZC15_07120 [Candidatus Omnitrophica bacterium]|nr:hypothetical protein [Candidatus Omnitrophota bacterium]